MFGKLHRLNCFGFANEVMKNYKTGFTKKMWEATAAQIDVSRMKLTQALIANWNRDVCAAGIILRRRCDGDSESAAINFSTWKQMARYFAIFFFFLNSFRENWWFRLSSMLSKTNWLIRNVYLRINEFQ